MKGIAIGLSNTSKEILHRLKETEFIEEIYIASSKSIDLIDEQVWLNGKRIIINQDYIKVFDQGLSKSPKFITGFNNTIYNNDNNFFNI